MGRITRLKPLVSAAPAPLGDVGTSWYHHEMTDYLTDPWWTTELPFEHGATRTIEDSISPDGIRLTTLEGRLWRPLNGENNTHRRTSKNSASLRAIPPRRKDRKGTLDICEDFPAGPMYWGGQKPGMQPGEELSGNDLEEAKRIWDEHRTMTIKMVEELTELGLHKSVANRLLEPHLWQTIVISATNWGNFFALRSTHFTDQAQPEMAAFADGIFLALENSEPMLRGFDQKNKFNWHLPYVMSREKTQLDLKTLKACAAARTCRVSRLNQDNTEPSVERDLETCDGLRVQRPMHASPFEHVAVPMEKGFPTRCNFDGWGQWRHFLEDEYKINSMA